MPPEIDFIKRKNDYNRLAQAILLKYFQEYSRFPEKLDDIPQDALVWVSEQLGLSPDLIKLFDWQGRTGMRYRSQIRAWLGFRPNTLADQEELHNWLMESALPQEHRLLHLEQIAYQHLKDQLVEPPTAGRMKRLVHSAIHRYERKFFRETAKRITAETENRLRQLVHKKREIAINESLAEDEFQDDPLDYPIHELRSDAGEAKVKTIKAVAARLKYLQQIALPGQLFAEYPTRFLQQYAQQAALESLSHLQRHQTEQTITLLAAFCWVRQRELTDQLIELVIQLLNRIRLKAKQRVEQELLVDFIRVGGKQLLYRLATAMWDNPDGIIRDVLFPLIGEDRLYQLVEEAKRTGNYYQSVLREYARYLSMKNRRGTGVLNQAHSR